MTLRMRALPGLAIFGLGLLGIACLPGGSDERPTPSVTVNVPTGVQSVQPTVATSATPVLAPSPTALPVLPRLATYTVRSGDTPLLIAENAGVPQDERDAWIASMLSLNNVDATSLQIGQQLILPPLRDGTAVTVADQPDNGSDGPGVTQPQPFNADGTPIAIASPLVFGTPAGTPQPTSAPGVPFVPTPPFVAFITPTPAPATATPSPAPTIAPGTRAWLTSSEETAQYYYCDLDSGWRSIPPQYLLAFDSEQKLLAIWGRFRTKAPDSVC